MKKILCGISVALLGGMMVFTTANADGGYIVKFKTDMNEICDLSGLDEISSGKNLYIAENREELSGLEEYIEYCETNDTAELIEGTEAVNVLSVPDDEFYSEQWQLRLVNADYAWELETYGNSVNVAVIDSGCNPHIDLNGSLAGGFNYTNNADSANFSDNIGHGTHVAGIIAARMNDIGIAGTAPKAKIYALKCVDTNSGSSDALVKAIYDAVDKYNCRVINMSLGIKSDKQALHDAVQYAYEKGVIMVAAIGNDGNSVVNYPAAYDEVIGVGSVGMSKTRSSFSQKNETVFVAAPGENVKSLKGTNSYTKMRGTSQATPVVAGAAAIALSADGDISPEDFMELIKATSEDLGDKGKDILYGWGLLNIRGIMDAIAGEIYVSPINDDEVLICNNGSENLNAWGIWGEFENGVYTGGAMNEIMLLSGKKIKLKYERMSDRLEFFLWKSVNDIKPLAKKRVSE